MSHKLQQAAACCTSKDAHCGCPTVSASSTRRARLACSFNVWLTAVKSHDSIDSRSIDVFVSEPGTEHNVCEVLFHFPSVYMQIFQATIVSLPHYDEGPINYLLKSQSQACYRRPQPGENKRRMDKYTLEWNKSPMGGAKKRPFKLRQVQPMPECFQSDVVEPIWCGEGVEECKKTSWG